MALDPTSTANDIVAALKATNAGITGAVETQMKAEWAVIIGALYTRIKADIVIQSQVATGIPVSTAGGPSAQTGATTAPGTATSQTVS